MFAPIGLFPRRLAKRRGSLVLTAIAVVGLGCAGAAPESAGPKPDPTYRPGQSIADSRLCSCTECFKASCCTGDPGVDDTDSSSTSSELGMSVSVCGRCARRVWTALEHQACADRAPEACCPGTVRG